MTTKKKADVSLERAMLLAWLKEAGPLYWMTIIPDGCTVHEGGIIDYAQSLYRWSIRASPVKNSHVILVRSSPSCVLKNVAYPEARERLRLDAKRGDYMPSTWLPWNAVRAKEYDIETILKHKNMVNGRWVGKS